MSKQQNDKQGSYFFLTLETRDRGEYFRDDAFRTRVELLWAATMRDRPDLNGAEYAVNDHALHALVLVSGSGEGLERLQEVAATFMELTQAEWSGEGELWGTAHKFRRIEEENELRSLRDFIVQKMLGGKELSESEEEEDDEEWY